MHAALSLLRIWYVGHASSELNGCVLVFCSTMEMESPLEQTAERRGEEHMPVNESVLKIDFARV